ncbi:MAG: acetyl-CoA hydrolase/transferase family protein [Angustibacter sp.]
MRVVDVEGLAGHLGGLAAGEPEGPRVVVSGNHATPWPLLHAFDRAVERYRLFVLNAQPGVPDRDGVVLETPFVGSGMRRSPRLRYLPSRLSLVPRLFGTTVPPDVVLLHTTAPRDGQVSLGVEVNVLPAAVEAVRARGGLVVAQLNPAMPWTSGDAVMSTDLVDLGVEVDQPLSAGHAVPPDDDALAIGSRVASLVGDGATLQTGIGAVPDATLHALTERRGLRIWTETFSDGVLGLERAGALDLDHPVVASFLFGSDDLYAWAHDNPRLTMLRTERTNAPALIAQQPAMTSINSALQVDLFAQANASRINARIYSGFGGQTDFIVGAMHSPGGQAVIALRSWHPRADCSTVVALVDEPVTSFQHSSIITEQGRAQIWGADQCEQARQIIENVAHPDVRDELREEARALGLA